MSLKHHSHLTERRWLAFTPDQQILMIANELNRAGHWLAKNDPDEVRLCYERALELIYLTAGDRRHRKRLREIMRCKEILTGYYAFGSVSQQMNHALLKSVLLLDPQAWQQLQNK